MLQSIIGGLIASFRKEDAHDHAQRELRQARVAWLQAQSEVDRADATELYYRQKVERLTDWLEQDERARARHTIKARVTAKPIEAANAGLLTAAR